jgi:hypothetical protein
MGAGYGSGPGTSSSQAAVKVVPKNGTNPNFGMNMPMMSSAFRHRGLAERRVRSPLNAGMRTEGPRQAGPFCFQPGAARASARYSATGTSSARRCRSKAA